MEPDYYTPRWYQTKGIIHRNEKTLAMLVIENHEKPIVLQLFGSNPDTMAFAAGYVSRNSNADIIDINFWVSDRKGYKGWRRSKIDARPRPLRKNN